ncbi:MAG: DUF4859 domain-containing protein [Muribaculaceae bacterium]|nr:DUF4859 domain-containing protein [Muribaculaceae bacterium]
MKKLYIYAIAALLGIGVVSCNSDDPSDATSKHEYAEGEAPYLRANPAATTSLNMEFPLAKIDQPQYIYLKDYASIFHKHLNMTVDETMVALRNGTVGFFTINTSRQRWDLTPANAGDYSWYYAPNGLGTAEDAVFTLTLDEVNRAIKIQAVGVPPVGTICNLDFGLAEKKNSAFDDYVRFSVQSSVTDPSKVVLSVNIPAGAYEAYSINLKNFAESIRLSMGMSADELIKALESDKIDVYLDDADGNRVVDADGNRPDYTSGALGYWLDENLNITYWNGDGYPANLMFLEYGGGGIYNLGNSASSTPAGTQATVRFEFVSVDDPTAFLQFVIAVTFD